MYSIGVKFFGRRNLTVLIIELNSFAKSTDVQSGPGMATIFSKAGGSGVGINKAYGQEEKKDKRLLRDR